VVIVDDHPLLREGTSTLLERAADIQVVGVASLGTDALRLVREHQPDVLLLDVNLPDMSGVEVARQVRASFPCVGILVLTGHDDRGFRRSLVHLGVQGYLTKAATGDEITRAIRDLSDGRLVLAADDGPRSDLDGLTTREYEVLVELVVGRRNTEIAETLSLSLKTVEFHLSHIFEKLGVRSRAEAILMARDQGLVGRR
jgi:DNA-binding NarL/FixJ family response regulator